MSKSMSKNEHSKSVERSKEFHFHFGSKQLGEKREASHHSGSDDDDNQSRGRQKSGKRKRSHQGADGDCDRVHRHLKHGMQSSVKGKHKQARKHGHARRREQHLDESKSSKHLHIDSKCETRHKHHSDFRDSADSGEEEDVSSLKHHDRSDTDDNNGRQTKARKTPCHPSKTTGCRGSSTVSDVGQMNAELDVACDFTKYKHSLSKVFFRDHTFSQLADRGSQDYNDFWNFVSRYQAFQWKKSSDIKEQQPNVSSDSSQSKLRLPQSYQAQYRINMSVQSDEFETFLKKNRLMDYQLERELTRSRLIQFRSILLQYLDFQQKKMFQRLHKILKDKKNLPIYQYRDRILETVKQHQVVVIAGDTGCGKSTQVSQYLMEAGYDKIACTQPRRIACISLAKRVEYEIVSEHGSKVGYQVRFDKNKTSATKILFLTEGLLLRQMATDPLLEMYSVVIIDEVHERHIFTDFLLGVLKCVLRQRLDLKLVLMSATINIDLFAGYFHNAPVLKVPGRLFHIDLEFCPIKKNEMKDSRRLDPTPYLKIMQQIDHKYSMTERGDLLIFVSGMSEIMSVAEAARLYTQQLKRWIVLPLHSALSVEEQDKVFDIAPEGVRKCIISTNIAETSVTIDGVRFVVDSGKVKEMSFDPKYKIQKLQEFWISKASAEQRKGRAGRTGPGVCFRLYAESDFDAFQDYTTPEIQRVTLDSLILQMISLGLPDARKFPFIEPPDFCSVENSILYLKEQGALAADESLTPIGQMLSMLPVDVVIGKMLIMGSVFSMIDPVLSMTAAMSVQSPYTQRAYLDSDAIAARKPLESEHGDPFTLLNTLDEWIEVKAQGLGTRIWSRRRALEEQRFYEMIKLKRQFKDLLKDHHLLDGGEERQQYLTSEDRKAKHGIRKKLRELRKDQQNQRKKQKVLSVEDEDFRISGDEDNGSDIRDLEFRLSNDLSQLQETSNQSRSFTLRDINLIKIILCSGLYPNVAIADEFNTSKSDSELAFHTKNKPFVLLHPTSIFASQPDLLNPKDSLSRQSAAATSKNLPSPRHELLAYVSLLETNNKPYLVNNMRVPALQTVTLFSNSIDTNTDCTRLICDGWLEIKFQTAETAELIVSSIIRLRSTWHSLLKARLQETFEGIKDDSRVSPQAQELERLLASKLTEFLNSDVSYFLRRVHSAEMQRLYVGPGKGVHNMPMMCRLLRGDIEGKEHPIKGGVQVTEYLTFNCLLDEESASIWGEFTLGMQRHWKCPDCHQAMIVSVLERLQHQAQCISQQGPGLKTLESDAHKQEVEASINHLRKSFFCQQCQKNLLMTTTEILKHKKSHSL